MKNTKTTFTWLSETELNKLERHPQLTKEEFDVKNKEAKRNKTKRTSRQLSDR